MKRLSRISAATALVLAVSACTSIEVPPSPPVLVPARNDGSETSELVAFIVGGPGYYPKGGWVIYVDGNPRAWLPARSVFTRIPVTPGTHEVTAEFRFRNLDVFYLIPVYMGQSEVKAGKSVDCAAGRRCSVKAALFSTYRPSYSLNVRAESLTESQLGDELEMYREEVMPNDHVKAKGNLAR